MPRHKRQKRYTITRGPLVTTSEISQSDARRLQNERIDWLLKNSGLWMERRWQYMILIYPTPDGFVSRVLAQHEILTGAQSHYTGINHGAVELWRVIDSARLHAAELAWSKESNDETHMQRSGLDPRTVAYGDLQRWIKFQRDYIRHKSLGRSDNDAWRLASGDPLFKETVP